MAPKKMSGAPIKAGEEPLTAVLLADSFTQVVYMPLVVLKFEESQTFVQYILRLRSMLSSAWEAKHQAPCIADKADLHCKSCIY